MIAIGKLIEKLTPLIIGSAPVISAIRKLVNESRMDSGEARIVNLEKAMELQSALNEKIDIQLRMIQALLANVQRTLRVLIIAVVGAVIFAISALVVALLR
jgi:predicted PurR-regulated permease PerM